MPKQITSKTGDAPIRHQGHTSNGNFGSNLRDKAKWHGTPSHESIK